MSYLVYGTLTGFDPRHAATAARHAERTLAMRPTPGRAHVLDLIGLAEARFAAGHPDGAAEVSDALFAEAAEIRSTRTRDRLRTVVAQSKRYDTAPARRFRERARDLTLT